MLLVVIWILFWFLHPALLSKIGIGHYRIEVAPGEFNEIWFLDTFAVLASNDAVAAGENPYGPNRLDYMRRPHSYGPAWLYLRFLGLGRPHAFAVGASLGAGFIAAVLIFLRPKDSPSLLWFGAIACSTPVLAALERGNNDLFVFLILTPLVPCLLSDFIVWRWLAVPILGFAAALKFYPAVGIITLLECGSVREGRWRVLTALLIYGLIAWHVLAEVPLSGMLPSPGGIFTFGAVSIFQEFGIAGIAPQITVTVVGLIIGALWWRSPVLRDWRRSPSQRREWMYFVLAATILTACFFVGQHYAYRWIFAIWLAPFLWSLSREHNGPKPVLRLARITAGLLIVLMWAETAFVFAWHRAPHDEMLKMSKWMSLAMQPVTWAFFICLLGFLTHFVRESAGNFLGNRDSAKTLVAL